MDKPSTFQQIQHRFTKVMRDPSLRWKGSREEQERVGLYQTLIFNSIKEAVSQCFPVITGLLPESEWDALVGEFIRNHPTNTPLFHQLPEAFVDYLLNGREIDEARPYMAELAHYEWIELAVECLEGTIEGRLVTSLEVCNSQRLQLSPLAMVTHYSYAVDKIGPQRQPSIADREPTWIIIYRDEADSVHFTKVNAMTVQLLEYLAQGNTPQQALEKLSTNLPVDNRDTLMSFGHQAIEQLCQQSILISPSS